MHKSIKYLWKTESIPIHHQLITFPRRFHTTSMYFWSLYIFTLRILPCKLDKEKVYLPISLFLWNICYHHHSNFCLGATAITSCWNNGLLLTHHVEFHLTSCWATVVMKVVVVAYLTHNVSMCFEPIEAVVETLHGCWKWCKDMSLYYNQNHGVLHA